MKVFKYAKEFEESFYNYPPEYKGAKPIEEQIRTISRVFKLDPRFALKYVKNLPDILGRKEIEGFMAFPDPTALSSSYAGAVKKVLGEIEKNRLFFNWRKDQENEKSMRLSSRTKDAFISISKKQKGKIWIAFFQSGCLQKGKSPRFAIETFLDGEFEWDAIMTGVFALTHNTRFMRYEELGILCPGTQFIIEETGIFGKSAFFYSHNDGIGFEAWGSSICDKKFGVASCSLID